MVLLQEAYRHDYFFTVHSRRLWYNEQLLISTRTRARIGRIHSGQWPRDPKKDIAAALRDSRPLSFEEAFWNLARPHLT
jgi:hypothetical protein